jgi:hypothetical protein
MAAQKGANVKTEKEKNTFIKLPDLYATGVEPQQ